MANRMEAMLDVCRRYGRIFDVAWAERRQMEPIRRTQQELAFLPAHLELTDAPLSPAPRWSMWIIIALFATSLLWACIGKLDIVAVASGKVVTASRTKVIQPMETSVVRRILVQDGQSVKEGDLLIELDAVGAAPDARKAEEALINAKLAAIRTIALARSIDTGKPPQLEQDETLPADRFKATQLLANSEFATLWAKQESMRAQLAQKLAELRTVETSIEPMTQYAEISRARVDEYKSLLKKSYVSRQDYLTREQERISAERDLAAQRSHRLELLSAITGAREQLSATISDALRQLLDEQRRAQEQIRQFEPELAKTRQRNALMQLRAPVDGTVQQLAVHTIGGVVTPAQPLLSVVPEQESLEIEATVLNGDIGFVKPGQPVTVKIESFPYTRYGYLTGTVDSVSHDAKQDEKLGLVFPARIHLSQSSLNIDGAQIRVTPGMALSAEIKTGKRAVIDYLLSPLRTDVDESLRER